MVGHALRLTGTEIRHVARGETNTHRYLRERLVATLVVSVAVGLVGSVAIYLFERHAGGTEIHNFGDALFFTTAQLLTISSSMANPLSAGGRVVDLVLELYGITVVASLAGSFGAFFIRRGHERDQAAGPPARSPV